MSSKKDFLVQNQVYSEQIKFQQEQNSTLKNQLEMERYAFFAFLGFFVFVVWYIINSRKKSATVTSKLTLHIQKTQRTNESLQNSIDTQQEQIKTLGAELKKYKPSDEKIKGDVFEEFVIKAFEQFSQKNDSKWELLDWRSDKIIFATESTAKIYAKNNTAPDFLFRHSISHEKIAIECKYRKNSFDKNDRFFWAELRQVLNYKTYSNDEKINTFILIGTGENPDKPTTTHIHRIQEKFYPSDYQPKQVYFTRQEFNDSQFDINQIFKKIFG